jgi:hypothetical protein
MRITRLAAPLSPMPRIEVVRKKALAEGRSSPGILREKAFEGDGVLVSFAVVMWRRGVAREDGQPAAAPRPSRFDLFVPAATPEDLSQ